MEKLLRAIGMPPEVSEFVLQFRGYPDLSGLTDPTRWAESVKALREELGEDPQGLKELACHLRCALEARKAYACLGYSEEIYTGTMAAFSRFVREHKESYGHYGFDRGFWTVRQVSCRLFRIGELEYELVQEDGLPKISLHIPSDADMTPEKLRRSWLQAKGLLEEAFPEYRNAPYSCRSWLLAPVLQELLPEGSKIRKFQQSFQLTALGTPSTEYLRWVYKDTRLKVEAYPENTTLQRNLKAWLLEGGLFQSGGGILIEEPFLPQGQDSACLERYVSGTEEDAPRE